jgi:sporulation protein YlmC with PRC-barrel domain
MPRPDWFDDDTMNRERSQQRERGYGDREMSEFRSRDRGAMFGRDREDRDFERGRSRPIGGWGGLGEDRHRERDRERPRGEDRRFGPDDHNRGIPMDETDQLIASNKVEGTPVYDRHGDKLGTIHNFMVHKTRGHVVYAVLKHGGGFLGLNERYYPLEWNQLEYDTRLGGYHVNLEEEDLKGFGSFDSEGRWHSRSGRERSRGGREQGRESGREREMREPW